MNRKTKDDEMLYFAAKFSAEFGQRLLENIQARFPGFTGEEKSKTAVLTILGICQVADKLMENGSQYVAKKLLSVNGVEVVEIKVEVER